MVRAKHRLAVYLNDSWCNPGYITVMHWFLTGILSSSLLNSGMFSHTILLDVYAPPFADAATKTEQMHSVVSKLITLHPNAFIAIFGNLNQVFFSSALTSFPQHVECNMRQYDTSFGICQCQGGMQDCSSATNLILFIFTYRPVAQQLPVNIRTGKGDLLKTLSGLMESASVCQPIMWRVTAPIHLLSKNT